MSKFDLSQCTKHDLVKVSSGETVGLAFIRKGEVVTRLDDLKVVEVEEDNALTSSGYNSQAEETGDQMVKEEPKEEESANISNIFLGDSSLDESKDDSISWFKEAECNIDPIVKTEGEESTAVLLSNLADQLLRGSGRESYKGTESRPVNVKMEVQEHEDNKRLSVTDLDLDRELAASGVRQGKKDLDKPGKMGWLREVVTHNIKGHVTSACYITPPHPVTGIRKRLKKQKDIVNYLEMSGNKELTFRNFNLNSRFLGLKPEFELVRTSLASGSAGISPKQSLFAEYYRDLPTNSTSGLLDYDTRKVQCLVENCGSQVSYKSFSNHMKQMHLPDEECSYCGIEFPATKIKSHQQDCGKRREENREGHQDSKGTKRKLESEMGDRKFLSISSWSGPEEQKTKRTFSPTEANEGDVGDEHGDIQHQNINIRYGSAKYSVVIEPERKMGRVMRKLAKMVGKPVDKLVFKVERSGRVIMREETMKKLVGEVFLVENL